MYNVYENKDIGHLEIKDRIFFGSLPDQCRSKCYLLHQKLEEAFVLMGGTQQPTVAWDSEEYCEQHKKDCEKANEEILKTATEIVKGLLGKDFMIAKDIGDDLK